VVVPGKTLKGLSSSFSFSSSAAVVHVCMCVLHVSPCSCLGLRLWLRRPSEGSPSGSSSSGMVAWAVTPHAQHMWNEPPWAVPTQQPTGHGIGWVLHLGGESKGGGRG
jgi:hypothetical protein